MKEYREVEITSLQQLDHPTGYNREARELTMLGFQIAGCCRRPECPGSLFLRVERDRPDFAPHPTTEAY